MTDTRRNQSKETIISLPDLLHLTPDEVVEGAVPGEIKGDISRQTQVNTIPVPELLLAPSHPDREVINHPAQSAQIGLVATKNIVPKPDNIPGITIHL